MRVFARLCVCVCVCPMADIAQAAFERADKDGDNKISFVEYQEYCFFNPEVKSWISFFDDPEEVSARAARAWPGAHASLPPAEP